MENDDSQHLISQIRYDLQRVFFYSYDFNYGMFFYSLAFLTNHPFTGLWPVPAMLQADQPAGQLGQGRKPPGVSAQVHPALHLLAGARLPVPQRQLPHEGVPQDEARGVPHYELQEEDQQRLPHLQAAHLPVLLPCQALQREQVPGAVLPAAQTEAQAEAAADHAAQGPDAAAPCRHRDGQHMQHHCQTNTTY